MQLCLQDEALRRAKQNQCHELVEHLEIFKLKVCKWCGNFVRVSEPPTSILCVEFCVFCRLGTFQNLFSSPLTTCTVSSQVVDLKISWLWSVQLAKVWSRSDVYRPTFTQLCDLNS